MIKEKIKRFLQENRGWGRRHLSVMLICSIIASQFSFASPAFAATEDAYEEGEMISVLRGQIVSMVKDYDIAQAVDLRLFANGKLTSYRPEIVKVPEDNEISFDRFGSVKLINDLVDETGDEGETSAADTDDTYDVWEWRFEDLPYEDENGEPYVYTVRDLKYDPSKTVSFVNDSVKKATASDANETEAASGSNAGAKAETEAKATASNAIRYAKAETEKPASSSNAAKNPNALFWVSLDRNEVYGEGNFDCPAEEGARLVYVPYTDIKGSIAFENMEADFDNIEFTAEIAENEDEDSADVSAFLNSDLEVEINEKKNTWKIQDVLEYDPLSCAKINYVVTASSDEDYIFTYQNKGRYADLEDGAYDGGTILCETETSDPVILKNDVETAEKAAEENTDQAANAEALPMLLAELPVQTKLPSPDSDILTFSVRVEAQANDSFTEEEIYEQIKKKYKSLSYQLYREGSRIGNTLYANDENDWSCSWEDLPRYDSKGMEYIYTVQRYNPTETAVPFVADNAKKLTEEEENQFTDTWTISDTCSVTAELIWDDSSNLYETRPETVEKIMLSYGDENDLRQAELTKQEDGSYLAVWENVPTAYAGELISSYVFTIPELSENYKNYKLTQKGSGQTYKLTETLAAKSFTAEYNTNMIITRAIAEKIGEYPETVTATLYLGDDIAPVPDPIHVFLMGGPTGNIASQSYKWMLPICEQDGTALELPKGSYRVVWDAVENKHLTTTIENRSERSIYRIAYEYLNLPGYYSYLPCAWEDDNNAGGLRPEKLTAVLLANGEPVDGLKPATYMANGNSPYFKSDGWTYLPKKDKEGKWIHYTLQIQGLPAYYELTQTETPVFSEEKGYGTTSAPSLKNTMTLKTQQVSAEVLWETDHSEIEQKNRPTTVSLTLEYTTDGENWKTYWGPSSYGVSPGTDGWKINWTLPDVDEDGNPVTFRVQENNLGIYSTTYKSETGSDAETGKRTTALTVTNTYQDAWNYAIDLSWDTEDLNDRYYQDDVTLDSGTRTLKYQLTISANDSYEPGELEVRLPYVIWLNRSGQSVVPTSQQISVPEYPGKNPSYAFSYEIDKHDSEDPMDYEIVFTNRDPVATGFKQTLTVGYTVKPRETIDCSEVTLTASAKGQSTNQTHPEEKTSNSIYYRIDTGAKVTSFTKSAYSKNGIEQGRLYSWNTMFGPKPEDFDTSKYNYVAYYLQSRIQRNQPYWVEFEDVPDHDGKIVSVKYYYPATAYADGSNVAINYDETTGRWKSDVFPITTMNSSGEARVEYYVVVAYPRTEHPDGEQIKYRNDAHIYCYAADEHEGDKEENDKNDLSDLESWVTSTWQDYRFYYSGEIVSDSKYMGGWYSMDNYYSISGGGVNVLQSGKDIRANFNFSRTVNGYNLINGYSFNMDDDAVYAYAKINGDDIPYVRLTGEDYSFESYDKSGVMVTVSYADINHSDGSAIANPPELIPEEPFTFWAKTDDEDWTMIDEIRLTQGVDTYYVPADLIDGKGYTAFRLTSPEGLKAKFGAKVYAKIKLKAASPRIQSWFAQGEVSYIRVDNFAAFRLYVADEQGEYHWFDGCELPNHPTARIVGLTKEDLAREGSYPIRRSDYSTLNAISSRSSMWKTVDQVVNDMEHSEADVTFTLAEVEYADYVDDLTEFYDDFSQNSGVYYDLLPKGYSLNPQKPITVKGKYDYNKNSYTLDNAALTSYEVIDNYRGTGRQLVIFRVETLLEKGKNWRRYSNYVFTGFQLQYTASISWDEYSMFPTGYNIAAFQRGDDRKIANSDSEQGYPGATQDKKIYVDAPDGKPALSDMDCDGVMDEKNTLYAYAYVTPELYTTVQSGISKMVKGLSSFYTQDDIANLNGSYSYKVQMTSSDGGTTSDVILIDILENAANVDGGTGEVGWKGSFTGVNYLLPLSQGIDVKVYYATQKNLSYNDEEKMKLDSGIWSQTAPQDLSSVTAVAFDLRTGKDGEPFKFVNDMSTFVEIYMKAPGELQGEAIYAYNRPSYWSTFQVHGGNVPQMVLNNGNRTTIRLRDLQEFKFTKLVENADSEEKTTVLGGAVFALYPHKGEAVESHVHTGKPGADGSCWEKTPIRTVTSRSNGTVSFTKLDSGTYAIVETKAANGINVMKDSCYWMIDVDATEGTVSDPVTCKVSASSSAVDFEKDEEGNYTLKNTRLTKNISVKKTWIDDSATKTLRPEKITFDLYRNGELYQTKELDASRYNYYTTIFKDLYVYDLYGNLYTYKIQERPVPGYTPDKESCIVYLSNYNSSSIEVKNTRLGILELKKIVTVKQETDEDFTFRVRLTDDSDAPISEEGTSYIVRRYASAESSSYSEENVVLEKGGIVTLTAKDGERLLLIGLPLNAKYTVTEDEIEGYRSAVTAGAENGAFDSNTIASVTFTNTPLVTVHGSKTWKDGDDQDGIRPEEITIRLKANGTEVQSTVVTPDEDGTWSWNFTGLDKYDEEKQEIAYTIEEDAVTGYEAMLNGYNITNVHTPATATVSGWKRWDDEDNKDGIRPEKITIRLKANGTEVQSTVVTPDEDGKWSFSFTELPKYEAGLEIEYTVTEDAVAGYETTVDGYNITNKHVPTTPPDEETPKTPGGEEPKIPGGEEPKTPDGEKPKTPGGEEPKTPGGEEPKTPGGETPKTPGGGGGGSHSHGGGSSSSHTSTVVHDENPTVPLEEMEVPEGSMIVENDVPKQGWWIPGTGDNSQPLIYMAWMLLSLCGLAFCSKKSRKDNEKLRKP